MRRSFFAFAKISSLVCVSACVARNGAKGSNGSYSTVKSPNGQPAFVPPWPREAPRMPSQLVHTYVVCPGVPNGQPAKGSNGSEPAPAPEPPWPGVQAP